MDKQITTKLLKAYLFVPYTPYLCQQPSSTYEEKQVFPFNTVAVIPLQPLAHRVLQCLIIHKIQPSHPIF
jgi:hypothetical protein